MEKQHISAVGKVAMEIIYELLCVLQMSVLVRVGLVTRPIIMKKWFYRH